MLFCTQDGIDTSFLPVWKPKNSCKCHRQYQSVLHESTLSGKLIVQDSREMLKEVKGLLEELNFRSLT